MLVMGPWFHGGWERGEGQFFGDQNFGSKTSLWFEENVELPFFKYYLKGEGELDFAKATIFISAVMNGKNSANGPQKAPFKKHCISTPWQAIVRSSHRPGQL